MLHPVDSIPPTALQSLALLHLNSCRRLNHTGMVLATATGKGAAAVPHNATSLVLGVDSIARNVPLSVVCSLIELQLFHLSRVRAIAAQIRAYRLPLAVALPKQQYGLYAGWSGMQLAVAASAAAAAGAVL